MNVTIIILQNKYRSIFFLWFYGCFNKFSKYVSFWEIWKVFLLLNDVFLSFLFDQWRVGGNGDSCFHPKLKDALSEVIFFFKYMHVWSIIVPVSVIYTGLLNYCTLFHVKFERIIFNTFLKSVPNYEGDRLTVE